MLPTNLGTCSWATIVSADAPPAKPGKPRGLRMEVFGNPTREYIEPTAKLCSMASPFPFEVRPPEVESVFHVDAVYVTEKPGGCWGPTIVIEPYKSPAWRCPACGFTTANPEGHA